MPRTQHLETLRAPGPMEEQVSGIPSCQEERMSLIPAVFLLGNPEKAPRIIWFVTLFASTVHVKYIKQEY